MRYKQVKIVPDNRQAFIEAIHTKNITQDKKDFFIQSLDYVQTHVDECDDFYIDKPYKFNLYDYKQKLTPQHMIKMRKLGFTETETNFFNYDKNFLADGKYIKLKNKIGYDHYYAKLRELIPWYTPFDEFLVVDRPCTQTLDELVFDKSVLYGLVDYFVENFEKGLWLNNFNNYAIRYDRSKQKFYAYDPDIFFVIEHNKDIKHLKTPREFLDTYIHYKLRKKDLLYRVSKPEELTEEVLNYMYYTYWLLENLCHAAREKLNDY